MEIRTEATVYIVELTCDVCSGIMDKKDMIWNNNDTSSLSDDTISYRYTCFSCNNIIISDISYPYQEFVKKVI